MNAILFFGVMTGGWVCLYRWLTGWARLESKFQCTKDSLNGQISRGSFRWVGARVNGTDIVLAVELYPDFLWLRPGFPLTLGMKAICIPWVKIEDVELKHSILGTGVTVNFGAMIPKIRISGGAGKHVHAFIAQFKGSSINDV